MLNKISLAAFLAAALSLAACKSPSTNPQDPYGKSSDPLPDRAVVLTNDEYTQVASQPGFYPIGAKNTQIQLADAARREAEDDRTIAQYLRAHPGMANPVPAEPTDRNVVRGADGNYRHSVRRADGSAAIIVTMGPRWVKAAIADGMRGFKTRDNQLGIYRALHAHLTPALRAELDLPDPASVAGRPRQYPASAIEALNDRVAGQRARIAEAMPADDGARLAPASCTGEEGYLNGSDRTGSPEDHPACLPSATGIVRNYGFTGKTNLTCVKNQANRGTCVSFALTSVVESQVAKSSGRFVNLSEQFLYEQSKLAWYRADYGDGLSASRVAVSMSAQSWPLPFENGWAYNPAYAREEDESSQHYTHSCDGYEGTCSDGSHQAEILCTDKPPNRYCGYRARTKAESGFTFASATQIWNASDANGSLARLLTAVQTGTSIIWGFSVTESFDAGGANGYVPYVGSQETSRGGHAVHAVGAIDNAALAKLLPSAPPGAGGGYLIVKNSWSTCWGDAGYVYVPYDFVRAYTTDVTSVAGS